MIPVYRLIIRDTLEEKIMGYMIELVELDRKTWCMHIDWLFVILWKRRLWGIWSKSSNWTEKYGACISTVYNMKLSHIRTAMQHHSLPIYRQYKVGFSLKYTPTRHLWYLNNKYAIVTHFTHFNQRICLHALVFKYFFLYYFHHEQNSKI